MHVRRERGEREEQGRREEGRRGEERAGEGSFTHVVCGEFECVCVRACVCVSTLLSEELLCSLRDIL